MLCIINLASWKNLRGPTDSAEEAFYCVILKQPIIGQAELIFTDGNDNQLFATKYEIVNFQFVDNDGNANPTKEMKLFLQQGENEKGEKNYCLMLSSEY